MSRWEILEELEKEKEYDNIFLCKMIRIAKEH